MSTANVVLVEDNIAALNDALVYDAFSLFSIPPGAIICPASEVLAGSVAGLPAPIALTYRELARVVIERLELNPAAYAVECWSNRSLEGNFSVDYHLDNDEHLRRETGRLSVPSWGSIYYAGPDTAGVGGTYFNPPLVEAEVDACLFATPQFADVVSPAGRLVSFRPGRVVIFDGRCPHCVEPFAHIASPRVTILMNLWPNTQAPHAR